MQQPKRPAADWLCLAGFGFGDPLANAQLRLCLLSRRDPRIGVSGKSHSDGKPATIEVPSLPNSSDTTRPWRAAGKGRADLSGGYSGA